MRKAVLRLCEGLLEKVIQAQIQLKKNIYLDLISIVFDSWNKLDLYHPCGLSRFKYYMWDIITLKITGSAKNRIKITSFKEM